ncbi:MAG: hypothetical protein HOZ81_49760 [Streptomyces sp.]|nr:hypothetical protein [Streptomyces sp.]
MKSTIPSVLDALVSRWTALLDGVQVVDGEPITTEKDAVCVGFTGDGGEPGVENSRSLEQLDLIPDREQYDVYCAVQVRRGATDMKKVRDRAYAIIDSLSSDLAADQTLDGVAGMARLTSESLMQEQTEKGAMATVRFSVHIDAFTTE